MNSTENKLGACKATRALAAQSLYISWSDLRQQEIVISENMLCDKWLAAMRKNLSVYPDGWYIPPPHGIGVLFGTVDGNSRHNYKNLRFQEMWPQENIFLDSQNTIFYVYASPVDRTTGMIGDFGMTVYFGDIPKVKRHLQTCLQIDREIFDYIEVGKSFAQVYNFATERFKAYGLTNEVTSITDPAGINIGHTVPASHDDWTEGEFQLLQSGDYNWNAVQTMIAKRRKFVNSIEQTTYQLGMAVTIEPRLTVVNDPGIPMASYHSIALIKPDGSKELLTNFEGVFRITGMDYMLG